MVAFHHVNVGVLPGGVEAEATFLVEMLGYRPVAVDGRLREMNVHWFEAADGSQVHISEDPEHQAAARAHVAVVVGDELDEIVRRLETTGHDVKIIAGLDTGRVGFCRDPAGNRWELRGS